MSIFGLLILVQFRTTTLHWFPFLHLWISQYKCYINVQYLYFSREERVSYFSKWIRGRQSPSWGTELGHRHHNAGISQGIWLKQHLSKNGFSHWIFSTVLIMSSSQTLNCLSSAELVSRHCLGLYDQRPCCRLEMGQVAALPAQRNWGMAKETTN